ncbi:MAG TPA: hypothetical protein V6C97_08730 [Oculatellaceae cyanobacterium]
MRVQISLLAALIVLSLGEPVPADDSPFHDDWVMQMQVEKPDRQFMYSGSSLNKIAKVTVNYYRQDQPDKKTLYEMLWFNDGKPIGLERKNELNIPAGKTSKIEVVNKKGTSEEIEKAIADAVIRLSVDAYRKRFTVLSIKVPQESFRGVVDAMNKLNCVKSKVDADVADTAAMNFSIEADQGGESAVLSYY